jgi:hypothetical protein
VDWLVDELDAVVVDWLVDEVDAVVVDELDSVVDVVLVVSSPVVVVDDEVVVEPTGAQPPASHASQQLACSLAHALPPGGALQAASLRRMPQWVVPSTKVRQHAT